MVVVVVLTDFVMRVSRGGGMYHIYHLWRKYIFDLFWIKMLLFHKIEGWPYSWSWVPAWVLIGSSETSVSTTLRLMDWTKTVFSNKWTVRFLTNDRKWLCKKSDCTLVPLAFHNFLERICTNCQQKERSSHVLFFLYGYQAIAFVTTVWKWWFQSGGTAYKATTLIDRKYSTINHMVVQWWLAVPCHTTWYHVVWYWWSNRNRRLAIRPVNIMIN